MTSLTDADEFVGALAKDLAWYLAGQIDNPNTVRALRAVYQRIPSAYACTGNLPFALSLGFELPYAVRNSMIEPGAPSSKVAATAKAWSQLEPFVNVVKSSGEVLKGYSSRLAGQHTTQAPSTLKDPAGCLETYRDWLNELSIRISEKELDALRSHPPVDLSLAPHGGSYRIVPDTERLREATEKLRSSIKQASSELSREMGGWKLRMDDFSQRFEGPMAAQVRSKLKPVFKVVVDDLFRGARDAGRAHQHGQDLPFVFEEGLVDFNWVDWKPSKKVKREVFAVLRSKTAMAQLGIVLDDAMDHV